ncbi:MAG: hypothetical protein GX567_16965 [Clostridia bacterium]|nr:hypothetical protein [Clostridia bacterium]
MERQCRKCLLREIDPENYQQKIHELVENMDPLLRAEESLYEERLAVCTKCDYLWEGLCGACGCFVELRAATKKQVCPYQKW